MSPKKSATGKKATPSTTAKSASAKKRASSAKSTRASAGTKGGKKAAKSLTKKAAGSRISVKKSSTKPAAAKKAAAKKVATKKAAASARRSSSAGKSSSAAAAKSAKKVVAASSAKTKKSSTKKKVTTKKPISKKPITAKKHAASKPASTRAAKPATKKAAALKANGKSPAINGAGKQTAKSLANDVSNLEQPERPKAAARPPADYEKFRLLLQALRRRLHGDVSMMSQEALGGSDGAADNHAPIHPAEVGTHSFEQEFTLNLLSSDGDRLELIEAALEKIAEGTYGACEECGGRIPKARLEVIPDTPYCVKCASRLEG